MRSKKQRKVRNRPATSPVVFPFARNVKPVESLFPETVTQFISQRADEIGDARCNAQYIQLDANGNIGYDETESYDDVEDALSFLKFYLGMICLTTNSKWSISGDTLEAIDEDGSISRMRIWKSLPEANNGSDK